jgi:ribosomal protein S18 acetylase RimI-like enzyme
MGTAEAPCDLLAWDSQFFGITVAKVRGDRMNRELRASIDAWCDEREVRCLYFQANPADFSTIREAEAAGFRLVDVRMTLGRNLTGWQPREQSSVPLRLARADDIAVLESIARESHRDSRFYADGGFPISKCDEMYAIWINNSCNGSASAVLVPDVGNGAEGYLTIHFEESTRIAQIGLVAVHPQCRSRGIGRALMSGALDWLAEHQGSFAKVVTQGRNIPAMRLYEGFEFLMQEVNLTYHRWYS